MTSKGNSNYSLFIDRDSRKIEITKNAITTSFPLNNIPYRLYQAIANLADEQECDELGSISIAKSPVHKANVVTYLPTSPFRVNIAPKFIRLTMTDSEIEKRIDDLEGELLSLQGSSRDDAIQSAKVLYRQLHSDESKIDSLRLGAVEMYGTSTYHNLLLDPRASLGFTWYEQDKSDYVGYQLNCITQILSPGTLFYRYMRVMRALFATGWLDVGYDEYVCAYCFWVGEVKEKTLQNKSGFDHSIPDE